MQGGLIGQILRRNLTEESRDGKVSFATGREDVEIGTV